MIDYITLNLDNTLMIVFILSMIPIAELRLSIPIGIIVYGLSWKIVLITSVFGNILIGIFVLYLLPLIFNILNKNKILKIIINKIYKITRRKGKVVDTLKYYGLVLYIGTPLPFTGVWTGSLAAHIFGLSKNKSIIAISTGSIIAGILVTLLVKTGKYLFLNI